MPQEVRLSIQWTIALLIAISVVLVSIVYVLSASAEDYVSTTSTSPKGDQYSIGWTIPSLPEPGGRSTRSTKSYTLETNHLDNGMQTLIHIKDSDAPTA